MLKLNHTLQPVIIFNSLKFKTLTLQVHLYFLMKYMRYCMLDDFRLNFYDSLLVQQNLYSGL